MAKVTKFNMLNVIRISVVMLLVFVCFINISTASQIMSNSGGGSWQYYKEITLNENSGSTLTDFQVLLELSGNNFPSNARSDGADIRFTDSNGNELSYWIESWDYSGKSTNMWVKVPSVTISGTAIIRIYYGNPSASSSSNGDATFEFFDDFEGNNLNINKWDETVFGTATKSIGNSILSMQSGDFSGSGTTEAERSILRETSFTYSTTLNKQPIAIGIRANIIVGDPDTDLHFFGLMNDNSVILMRKEWTNGVNTRKLHSEVAGSVSKTSYWTSDTDWHKFKITASSTKISIYEDDIPKGSITTNIPDTVPLKPFFEIRTGSDFPPHLNNKMNIDWFYVSKYVPLEPSITIGNEQFVSTPVSTQEQTSTLKDSDGDGWSDEKETSIGTNPYSVDSDSDGINDPQDPNPNVPEKTMSGFGVILAMIGIIIVFGFRRR